MKMSENASVKPYQDKKKRLTKDTKVYLTKKKKNKIVVKDKNCFLV